MPAVEKLEEETTSFVWERLLKGNLKTAPERSVVLQVESGDVSSLEFQIILPYFGGVQLAKRAAESTKPPRTSGGLSWDKACGFKKTD